jgi:uncharacterized membrane protein YqjE
MRTALFLLAGFLLMGVCLILGKLFAPQYPEAPRLAAIAYVAVWFVVAAANMWVGVAKAGYLIPPGRTRPPTEIARNAV